MPRWIGAYRYSLHTADYPAASTPSKMIRLDGFIWHRETEISYYHYPWQQDEFKGSDCAISLKHFMINFACLSDIRRNLVWDREYV